MGDELSRNILDRLDKLDEKFDRHVERLGDRVLECEKATERVKVYVTIAGAIGAALVTVAIKALHL